MHKPPLTFAHFISTPENRSALEAVREVADFIASTASGSLPSNPLLLHGPPGTGKTHLVSALVEQATRQRPDLAVVLAPAGDLIGNRESDGSEEGVPTEKDETGEPAVAEETSETLWPAARRCDVLVVEDLQRLPTAAVAPLVKLMDTLLARGRPMVFTANTGPQQLENRHGRLPARLTNRLAGGMVIRLYPWQPESRRRLLLRWTEHLRIDADALDWLAKHLAAGRQLLGAVGRLEALAQTVPPPLHAETVAGHFREQPDAVLTVAAIAERVSGYFQVQPQQLQSKERSRELMIPRQVSMYLARQLTGLSLEQIGAYFGGRDHTTVLHACRKVEGALDNDAMLSGAVRQLQADLG
jgi:chromosomal replication initiator protein